MRNRLSQAWVLFSVLAALVLWTGAAAARSFDDILAAGEIEFAVYRDFPPFSYRRDGKLVGADVDLGHALAKRMKLKARFFELTAGETVEDDLRNGVWKGHYLARHVADAMLHIPTEREFALRQTEAVVFAPYFREAIVVARNPERVNSRDTVAIFAEEKVGVETDSLADIYLTSALGGSLRSNVIHFTTLHQATDALVAGQVAAVMGSRSEIASHLAARKSKYPVARMEAPGLTKPFWELGMAVKENNRDLAYALTDAVEALMKDGTLAAIWRRHNIPYQAPEP